MSSHMSSQPRSRGEGRVNLKFQKREFSYEHPVAKPSPEKHRAEVAALEARMEKVRQERDKSHERAKEYRQEAMNSFQSDDAKKEFDQLAAVSKGLRDQIRDVNDKIENAHKNMAEQKEIIGQMIREYGSKSAEAIEKEVEELSDQIAHTSLDRSEEQELVGRINRLKASKTHVHEREEAAAKRDEMRLELEKFKELRTDLFQKKHDLDAKFEETSTKFQPAREKRSNFFDKAKEMDKKGDELHAKFLELSKERRQLWSEWKKVNDEWFEGYVAARDVAYKKFREAEQARFEEWLAKADERKKYIRDEQLRAASTNPFVEQLANCERAIEILTGMIDSSRQASTSHNEARETSIPTDRIDKFRQDGMVVLQSKKDRMAEVNQQQASKKRRRNRGTKKGKSVSESEFDIISLSELLDILTALNIETVPKNIGECEELRGSIRGQMKSYNTRSEKIIQDNVEKLKARWEADDKAEQERKAKKKTPGNATESTDKEVVNETKPEVATIDAPAEVDA